ncbi:MAG TPA: YIP1 family protein [Gemmatimonadaceae bacterium]|nr:YIP1 family protein [Gemmatimonadaceae bacterium]
MSESSAAPTTASAPPQQSFWEDLIDIYFQPANVFRRRQNSSVWPPMLFVAIAVGVIFFITFNTLQPIFDAEFARGTAKALAKNPQMTPEMAEKMRGFSTSIGRYAIGVIMLVTMVVIGSVTWLVGKIVGSAQTYHAALVVAAWAYMPRVIGSVLAGVQGLLMDPAKLTSQLSISLSPARFYDVDATNPLLYQALGRLDLITIWVTILIGVGVYVTGKVSKGRATVVAVLMWVLGTLPALRQAYVSM